MGKAVQFRGSPQLLKAFGNVQIPAWSVMYDRRVIHKYASTDFTESEDLLKQFLKGLEQSNSTAEYILNLYEDVTDRKKIKASLEPDYSYNFTLFNDEDYPSPGQISRSSGYAMLLDKFNQLEEKIDKKKEEEESEQIGATEPTWVQHINKLLENPKVQDKIGEITCSVIEKVGAIVDGIISPTKTLPMFNRAASMGGVEEQPGAIKEISQENFDKINKAVSILASIDAELGDNLMKIAELAQNNPKKYKSLTTMLKTFL